MSDLRIVVLDRGFVFVSELTRNDKVSIIKNARCVRTWGTSEGLAELALSGPIEGKTILEKPCTVEVSDKAILFSIPCKKSKWEEKDECHAE